MIHIEPEIIWFVVGLALVLLEFALPGVIIVFFGIGAWVTAFTSWLDLTTTLKSQLLVFSFSSVIFLFSLRRYVRSRFTGVTTDQQDPARNYDDFIGSSVTVLEDLIPGRPGAVEFRGTRWKAVSDKAMAAGDLATIRSRDGLTLTVVKQGGDN